MDDLGFFQRGAISLTALISLWIQIRPGILLLLAANLTMTIFRRMLVRFPA